ncbi:SDR family NAD(P)-dependent oxidoreductase [Salinibacterium soli]|uniref:SDR family NAD(P)-dependent oxidoreductase n=1 Tax=Antiquaquibacter soli TaxID=3064523 RepID=A0ABT9BPV3_9MICO|nr:SDR family NAD(P)-dependent oxidoreductase [Protaetiibacter sp. WY-16]MDO7883056.1 SDR family NAD(P)-dependent oxidoreductase [Protaetiibacter sp. WY-16]
MSRLVLVAGAGSDSGRAVCARLMDDGARVLAVGSRLWQLADTPATARYEADLSSASAVETLAARVRAEHGTIDGLVHLVGGWRAGRADDDWAWLESRVIETFRLVSREFHPDLAAAPAGRLVMVSSSTVEKPTWSNANYAAAKAAAEAWARAAASGFAKGGTAASVILVVRSLGEGDGATGVDALADRISTLWDDPAAVLNGTRIPLAPERLTT